MSGLYKYSLSFLKAMGATRFFSLAGLPLFLLHVTDFLHDVMDRSMIATSWLLITKCCSAVRLI